MLQRYCINAAEVWHQCCRVRVYCGKELLILIVIPLQVRQLNLALPWIVAIDPWAEARQAFLKSLHFVKENIDKNCCLPAFVFKLYHFGIFVFSIPGF